MECPWCYVNDKLERICQTGYPLPHDCNCCGKRSSINLLCSSCAEKRGECQRCGLPIQEGNTYLETCGEYKILEERAQEKRDYLEGCLQKILETQKNFVDRDSDRVMPVSLDHRQMLETSISNSRDRLQNPLLVDFAGWFSQLKGKFNNKNKAEMLVFCRQLTGEPELQTLT